MDSMDQNTYSGGFLTEYEASMG